MALLGGVAVGLVASSTVRIAPQWERVVVLRLGKFNRIDGPGLYVVVPIVESVAARVDQRIITTPFSAEEAVTADLVPLGIDAGAVLDGLGSQRRLRGGGRLFISGMVGCSNRPARCGGSHQSRRGGDAPRAQLDNEVKEILEEKTRAWGITVVSVEIRDIAVPSELQDALSKEAQAERERNSRLLLARGGKGHL